MRYRETLEGYLSRLENILDMDFREFNSMNPWQISYTSSQSGMAVHEVPRIVPTHPWTTKSCIPAALCRMLYFAKS